MPGHPAVGVNDNLPARESAVGRRSALDELPGRIDEDPQRPARELRSQNRSHDPFLHLPGHPIQRLGGVLCGCDHGGDGHRVSIRVVGDGDLSLAVGPQVRDLAIPPHLGEAPGDAVGERDGERHQFRRFIAGESEHHSLVSGPPAVHAHRNVRRLLPQPDLDRDGVGVEAVVPAGVPDPAHRVADDRLDLAVRGTFP